MEIVVNDTNIFIDLYSIGILEQFFDLPFNVHTVDFIINEISDTEQIQAIRNFIDNGKLHVHSFDPHEISEIIQLNNTAGGNVSIPDCAVWLYARKNNYTLLTGDAQLRKKAIQSSVDVKGIVYVFDCLVKFDIISPSDAASKLDKLLKLNPRLPKSIINERIEKWSR